MTTYTADLYSADGIETMRAKFAAAVTEWDVPETADFEPVNDWLLDVCRSVLP